MTNFKKIQKSYSKIYKERAQVTYSILFPILNNNKNLARASFTSWVIDKEKGF